MLKLVWNARDFCMSYLAGPGLRCFGRLWCLYSEYLISSQSLYAWVANLIVFVAVYSVVENFDQLRYDNKYYGFLTFIARHFNSHRMQWFIIQASCLRGKAHFLLSFTLLSHACTSPCSACSWGLSLHVALRLSLCFPHVSRTNPLALSSAPSLLARRHALPINCAFYCIFPCAFLCAFPLFLFEMTKLTALFRRHCKFFFQIVGCNAIFMTYRLTSHNSLCYFWYRKNDGCAYHYKHCLWMRMKDLRNSRIITNNNGYQV